MEDKISKGGNYKRFKKGSKWEHGNLGPENFVYPPFKISGSAPAPGTSVKSCWTCPLSWHVAHPDKWSFFLPIVIFQAFMVVRSLWSIIKEIKIGHLLTVIKDNYPIIAICWQSTPPVDDLLIHYIINNCWLLTDAIVSWAVDRSCIVKHDLWLAGYSCHWPMKWSAIFSVGERETRKVEKVS